MFFPFLRKKECTYTALDVTYVFDSLRCKLRRALQTRSERDWKSLKDLKGFICHSGRVFREFSPGPVNGYWSED